MIHIKRSAEDFRPRVAVVVSAVLMALASGAHSAILGQDKDGDVLLINTTNAQASVFLDLADVGAGLGGTEPNNSPNALGYNGSAFRTNFSNTSPATVQLFRNDTSILTLSTEPTFSVAAADVKGNSYYFVDRQFGFSRVDGIDGGSPTLTNVIDFDGSGGGATIGDIAIAPDGLSFYFSNGTNTLRQYNLNSGALITSFSGAVTRYAGLAFDGGALYGVIGGNPTGTGTATLSQLYRLDFTGPSAVTPAFIGNVTLNGNNVFLTDAAPVPEPSTYALLGVGFALVGMSLRRSRKR